MEDKWPTFCKSKLVPPHKLNAWSDSIRSGGETIVTLNGSFDLLHAGHLKIIYEASKQADVLIVALNTDESIRRYKGSKRPIVDLEHRLQMMCALSFVDYVTWFAEDDPRNILEKIQPDVHVNGAEYGEKCIEAEVVKKYGGKLHIVSLVGGLSTSKILEKIHETSGVV